MNSPLLLNEHPLQVLPTLAVRVGLNQAIALQQLHFWLNNKDKRNKPYIRDERRWVYNTYEEWREQFPFWSIPTIKRIFLSLEESKLIISQQFDLASGDARKYYTIDYERLNNPDAVNESIEGQGEQASEEPPLLDQVDPMPSDQTDPTPSDQSDPMDEIKLIPPSDQVDPTLGSNRSHLIGTETNAETNAETSTECVSDSDDAALMQGGGTHTQNGASAADAFDQVSSIIQPQEESLSDAICAVCGVQEAPSSRDCPVAAAVRQFTTAGITSNDVRAFHDDWYFTRRKSFPLTLGILRADLGAFVHSCRVRAGSITPTHQQQSNGGSNALTTTGFYGSRPIHRETHNQRAARHTLELLASIEQA